MLSLFGILTFIFFMQTLRMNRALQARPRLWPSSNNILVHVCHLLHADAAHEPRPAGPPPALAKLKQHTSSCAQSCPHALVLTACVECLLEEIH